jgi:hypothetical protein
MKSYLPLLCLLFMGASAADCGHNPGVKVWEFSPEEAAKPLKGWYRGDEIVTFGDSDVKYGINATDMEFILNKLKSCEIPPNVKIDNSTILDVLLNK